MAYDPLRSSQAARARMLSRIRARLGRDAAAAPPPLEIPILPRADHPGEDRSLWAARFAEELAAVDGTSEQVAAFADALVSVERYCDLHALRAAITWDLTALPQPDAGWLQQLADVLASRDVKLAFWRGDDRRALQQRAAQADLGIIIADAAIAASGTVVVSGVPGKGRSVSLLPEHIIVLIPHSRLYATLRDAFAGLRGAGVLAPDGPQNVTLITGPSKSADIGLEPVTGVHGPRHVHAILWPDDEPRS